MEWKDNIRFRRWAAVCVLVFPSAVLLFFSMYSFWKQLLFRAIDLAPSRVSQNWSSVVLGLFIFAVAFLLRLYLVGWRRMLRKWKQSLAILMLPSIIGWCGLVLWSLTLEIKKINKDALLLPAPKIKPITIPILPSSAPKAKQAGSLAPSPVSVFIACTTEYLPLHIPANTSINFMRVYPSDLRAHMVIPMIGVFNKVSAGDQEMEWPSERDGRWMTVQENQSSAAKSGYLHWPFASKCEITNYGHETLESIEAYLGVETPDGKRHVYPIPFDPLVSTKPFRFYVINACSSGVVPKFVSWANEATVKVVGEALPRPITLQFGKAMEPNEIVFPLPGGSSFLWNGLPGCEGW